MSQLYSELALTLSGFGYTESRERGGRFIFRRGSQKAGLGIRIDTGFIGSGQNKNDIVHVGNIVCELWQEDNGRPKFIIGKVADIVLLGTLVFELETVGTLSQRLVFLEMIMNDTTRCHRCNAPMRLIKELKKHSLRLYWGCTQKNTSHPLRQSSLTTLQKRAVASVYTPITHNKKSASKKQGIHIP